MGYQKNREEFIRLFAREFPNARHDDASTLLRAASGEQRSNEIASSIEETAWQNERREKADERRTARVQKICDRIGAVLEPNGDPRGFPFLLKCPSGFTNDWGHRGLGVPGRGLPARCF